MLNSGSGQPTYIILGTDLGNAGCTHGTVPSSPYQGDMDDFQVYSRELSSNDVNILYTN
jgi:hypothetical protein